MPSSSVSDLFPGPVEVDLPEVDGGVTATTVADPGEVEQSERTHSFSPSAAGLWQQCPRRWWYRYVERLPEPPPGEPAILGTFVHAILEELLDLEPAERTEEQARILAGQIWPQVAETDDWLSLELSELDARKFRQRAWATVETYFSMLHPSEVVPVARELEVKVDLDGVPFRGFVDLVERDPVTSAVVVTDYKTGAPPVAGKPWSDEQKVEKLWQPLWYAAALTELGDHVPQRARLLYFTVKESASGRSLRPATGELPVDITPDALDGAKVELRRRWDEVEAARSDERAPEGKAGPLCGWCPFVDVCEVGEAEVTRRWNERNSYTGERRLRRDAPAVEILGLVDDQIPLLDPT